MGKSHLFLKNEFGICLKLTEQEAEMMKKKLRKTKRIIVSREKSFIVAVLILSKP